ncbi:MAG: hypothetical protein KKH98_06195 [Spirochaetes bacterium]|nr:hypothetical protein [Spirochaetota bacterium]
MKKEKTYLRWLALMAGLVCLPLMVEAVQLKTINPYSFLIGNAATEIKENIYTANPASIANLDSSMLFQTFTLEDNPEQIFFSQNLVIRESDQHSLLLGYSLVDGKTISMKNSLFRAVYAFNFEDFLFLGAGFTYKDTEYKKFDKAKLSTDLGAMVSLKFDWLIKFANFGIYGINAKPEKINMNFPTAHFGEYTAWGWALGLDLTSKLDVIVSGDSDLVRDSIILGRNDKIFRYGVQLKSKRSFPWLGVMASGEYKDKICIGYSAGASLEFTIFSITYGAKRDLVEKSDQQYLSFSFPLFNRSQEQNVVKKSGSVKASANQQVIVSNEEEESDTINIHYYNDGTNCRISFKGDLKDVEYWTLEVVDKNLDVIRKYQANDTLPDGVIWDGNDSRGRSVPNGTYTVRLEVLKDRILLKAYESEKEIMKGIM